MDDTGQRPSFNLLNNDVGMVWHYTPSQHAITLAIEVQECGLNDIRSARLVKKSPAEIRLHSLDGADGRYDDVLDHTSRVAMRQIAP